MLQTYDWWVAHVPCSRNRLNVCKGWMQHALVSRPDGVSFLGTISAGTASVGQRQAAHMSSRGLHVLLL